MPTHKSAREILDELRSTYVGTIFNADMTKDNEALDTAIASLAELVRGDKKNIECTGDPDCDCYDNKRYNEAIEHIARLIEGK